MVEMRSFLPSRCALGDLRAQLVTPSERAATGTPRPARKNILREAQAFADSMPISRHRGRVYLSASRWWKTGGLTREWDFHQRWATIFTTPMAIGRYREESSQRPTTGRKADGSKPNGESFCLRATIFTDSCSYRHQAWGKSKGGSEIDGANRPEGKNFGGF